MIDKEQLDEQIQILTARARDHMTFEQAIHCFATFKVVFDELQAVNARLSEQHRHAATMLGEQASSDKKRAAKLMGIALALEAEVPDLLRRAATEGAAAYKRQASKRAKDAADHRHSSPGGAREKKESIQRAWASGKYSSRVRCAEEEYEALGMSFSTAQKALQNTPHPLSPMRGTS